jgi:hypothetical protein
MRLISAFVILLLSPLSAGASGGGLSFDGLLSPETMLSGGYGTPTPPAGGATQGSSDLTGKFSSGLLFQDIGEDFFVTLDLKNEISIGPLKLGVQVPISVRIADEDPQDDDILRTEDWDELADFARIVRFLELNFGDETWGFRARIGALEGESIGHGTALAGYYNSVDRDHYQGGLALRAGFGLGGMELLVDNILAPEVIGGRIYLRPASMFTDADWGKNLVFGVSYVTDTQAPVTLKNASGSPQGSGQNVVFEALTDDKGNLQVAERDAVDIVGFDLEYTVMKNTLVDIVPYIDTNILLNNESGFGLHAGTFINLKIPGGFGPTMMTRLEYRYVGEGYAPRYIDSLYEAHRLMFTPATATTAPQTKLAWLRDGGLGSHGWMGELFFDFAGWVKIGGTYEDYEGPNNSALTLNLVMPQWDSLQAGALYTHRGFDSLEDAFNMDGALFLAFLKSQVWGPVYATASYSRSWALDDTGNYLSQDDWNIGLGLDFTY